MLIKIKLSEEEAFKGKVKYILVWVEVKLFHLKVVTKIHDIFLYYTIN